MSNELALGVFLGLITLCPILFALVEFAVRRLRSSRVLDATHVLIIGGSSGIGLSLAAYAVRSGSSTVTIVSRSKAKLEAAKEYLIGIDASGSVRINVLSADCTDVNGMTSAIDALVETHGPPDYTFCAAGSSVPGYFLEQPIYTFRSSMELNYMGTIIPLKVVVPHLVRARSGHVVLISSGAGLSGWLGYSTYCPTKFAVRGLAETLRNELVGFNVKVSVAYPPDTDTDGFKTENETKPEETVEMLPPSTYSPDIVSQYIWWSVLKGDFNCSCPDLLQDFLIALMSGVTPRRLYGFETLVHPLLVAVSVVFRWNADRIACKYPMRMADGISEKKCSFFPIQSHAVQ